jgi:hypothetical protein
MNFARFISREEIMKCKVTVETIVITERKRAPAFYIYLVRINLALVEDPRSLA